MTARALLFLPSPNSHKLHVRAPLATSQLPSTTKRSLTACRHRQPLLTPIPPPEAAMVTTRSGKETAGATKPALPAPRSRSPTNDPRPPAKKQRLHTKKPQRSAKKGSSVGVDRTTTPPSVAIGKLPVEIILDIAWSLAPAVRWFLKFIHWGMLGLSVGVSRGDGRRRILEELGRGNWEYPSHKARRQAGHDARRSREPRLGTHHVSRHRLRPRAQVPRICKPSNHQGFLGPVRLSSKKPQDL